jgi:hypothetical protein
LGEGAGEEDALLLAARELADLAGGEVEGAGALQGSLGARAVVGLHPAQEAQFAVRPIMATSITRTGKSQSTEARWGT